MKPRTVRQKYLRRSRELAKRSIAEELETVGTFGPWEVSLTGPRPHGAKTREAYERAVLALVRIGNAAYHLRRRPVRRVQ